MNTKLTFLLRLVAHAPNKEKIQKTMVTERYTMFCCSSGYGYHVIEHILTCDLLSHTKIRLQQKTKMRPKSKKIIRCFVLE